MQTLPSWACEIEVGDPICDKDLRQIGGFVLKKILTGGRKNWPAYLVENNGGQQFIISEDSARLMGGPEQKFMERMWQIQEERRQNHVW